MRFYKRQLAAVVAELVDAPDLGSGAVRCESSSLSDRTIILSIERALYSYRAEYLNVFICWAIAKR